MSDVIFKSDDGREMIMGWYEDKLARFSVAVESKVLETSVGETHLLVAGPADAPPVVLLHGGFMNGAAMEAEIAALAPAHRVYALDMMGHAGKSAEKRLEMESNEPVRWLAEVLDQLSISQVNLIALSLGGLVALKFIRSLPERVCKLVLYSAGGVVAGRGKGMRRMMSAMIRVRVRPTEKNFARVGIKPFYSEMATPDADLVRLMGLGFKYINPDARARGMIPYNKIDLALFTAPVMVVYGEKDVLFEATAAVAQAKALFVGPVTTLVVPNQGHFMGQEVQHEVLGKITDFLSG